MKILIADKLADSAINELKNLGMTVVSNPDLSAEDLPKSIADHNILIVRSTKVTTDTINSAKDLKMIIRAGAGVNTIDVKTALAKSIHVTNCPGTNTDAVAELVLGLIISADRRIVNATTDMRAGKWRKKEYGKSRGLKGRTLGIMGFGKIGQTLSRPALAMGMKIAAWDIALTPEMAKQMNVIYCATAEDLVKQSDVISVHVAYNPQTKHLVNQNLFNQMKKGAIFINASRGEVVDTAALKVAIKEKGLRVGVDVYEGEPEGGEDAFKDTELAQLVCSATPHVGASTDQSLEAVAGEVIRIVKTYKETGKALNAVS